MRAVVVLVFIAATAACTSEPFVCANDDQCTEDGAAGSCQPNGYCSFPDAACPSGQRYGDAAPSSIAGMCVQGDEGTSSEGSSSSSTSSAEVGSDAVSTGDTSSEGSSSGSSGSSGSSTSTSTGSSSSGSSTGGPIPCPTQVDGDTVALYRLDDAIGLLDAVGRLDGTWLEGSPTLIDGPTGCGMAAVFEAMSHGVVADAPAFDLEVGSFDLWVQLPPPPPNTAQGLISRDATNQSLEGHVTLWYGPQGRLAVRHQPLSPDTSNDRLVCSGEPLPQGTWVHVGINFGAPDLELYVDGVAQAGEGEISILGSPRTCGGDPATFGIDGNANPWVIGASAGASAEGSAVPTEDFFGGAIDEFRISSVRRDFADGGF